MVSRPFLVISTAVVLSSRLSEAHGEIPRQARDDIIALGMTKWGEGIKSEGINIINRTQNTENRTEITNNRTKLR